MRNWFPPSMKSRSKRPRTDVYCSDLLLIFLATMAFDKFASNSNFQLQLAKTKDRLPKTLNSRLLFSNYTFQPIYSPSSSTVVLSKSGAR
jgi:hypothetical protein